MAMLLAPTLQAATPVTLQPLSELWFEQEQGAPATALPLNAPVMSAELNARVTELHVEVGDTVSAGDLLLELDCRRPQADLQAAKAGLRQFVAQYTFARHQVERADDLLKKRSISDQEVEQRKSEEQRLAAQVDAQKSAILQAEIQVGNCRLEAPFAAIVAERMADKGMLAAMGTPLLRLVQAGEMEVTARLDPRETESVASGSNLRFEAHGERYALALRTIVPFVDETTRTREARFGFPGEKPVPGTAGRLVWQSGSKLVPADFLVRRKGRLGIFTAVEGKAVFRPLDNALEGRPASVALPPETEVVVLGRESLADGDAIEESGASAADEPEIAADSDE
jgi:RND family efflux transporter MFP subunit